MYYSKSKFMISKLFVKLTVKMINLSLNITFFIYYFDIFR